ncbi:max-like protein X isoform X1 [Ursus maritimus]|uniref:Max-like protein X n=2 Tax=Ursus TaxID=9639 RepID=A0A8M1GP33_URSMA|nr:max-like protein X isoform X1 [Ursus maritimus]
MRLASSSRLGARPRAGFRFGGLEMTEPGASPDDPWVKVEYAYSDNSLDPGLFVESTRKGSVVSRANSIGSTSASSVPNTDDEDSDYHQESYKESYKDRRRRAHTQAEQKRRDAIKRGYDDLQTIVPTCQQQDFSIGSQKLSKAIVLQKTIDYIQFLHKEKKKQEEEVSMLRKDVTALKIMKVNYEQIVKAHQDNPHEGEDQVSDQVKFNVFQGIMDSLFQSFNASISVASFQELSACVFSWIEEHYAAGDRGWRPAPAEEPAVLTGPGAEPAEEPMTGRSLLLGHRATGLLRLDCAAAHRSAGSWCLVPQHPLVLNGAGVFVL